LSSEGAETDLEQLRVFKSKGFSKFARRESIADAKLCEAVKDAEEGKIDADYGGGVIKQRISRPGEGKSGGYRAIILFRRGSLAFFVHGFAKSDQANIDASDEKDFKDLAKRLLVSSEEELDALLRSKLFSEVLCNGQS